ncbi:hypothetical protein GQR60_00735 [Labilibaculum sp. A4]|uniref:Lipoprotein n=1 Tax=Labilibaculum antarcticum TaxID=1717717 RepID=A0A1Y1CPR2_9BACT|nr:MULTISPECIES: hypothetical protein [Labilibaculum]MDQ1769340.1 hypothetical protein [Labilibaculum euxinus]MWN74866.1 hypothetical protein [Labilibaculum euxinus]BAX82417.1 hypothetical protein ALGA_4126 [Labilibaculum antarcticum]
MKSKTIVAVLLSLVIFVACGKNDDEQLNEITGKYTGTLSVKSLVKSGLSSDDHAYADVMIIGDQIQIHCSGGELDTTFMLDYYQHSDSVFVCHTGEEFEQIYGHMKGENHMAGGMMSDLQNGETEWMHHLSDEHEEDDEHFGNFDMRHNTFNYLFKMSDGDYQFMGTK